MSNHFQIQLYNQPCSVDKKQSAFILKSRNSYLLLQLVQLLDVGLGRRRGRRRYRRVHRRVQCGGRLLGLGQEQSLCRRVRLLLGLLCKRTLGLTNGSQHSQ